MDRSCRSETHKKEHLCKFPTGAFFVQICTIIGVYLLSLAKDLLKPPGGAFPARLYPANGVA